MKSIIQSDHAPAPIGPYNQAIQAGSTLYISGQIALSPDGEEMLNANIMQETEQVMRNLEAVLKAAGMDLRDLVKCSIFITDMAQFAAINEIYASFFTNAEAPARETVAVAALPKKARVEISAIAYRAD